MSNDDRMPPWLTGLWVAALTGLALYVVAAILGLSDSDAFGNAAFGVSLAVGTAAGLAVRSADRRAESRITARREALALGLHWVEDDGTVITEEKRLPSRDHVHFDRLAQVIRGDEPVRLSDEDRAEVIARVFAHPLVVAALADPPGVVHVRPCLCFKAGERVVGYTDPRCR